MKRLYVALHGNPGFAGDLAPLTDNLGAGDAVLHFQADAAQLTLETLLSNLDSQVAQRGAQEIIVMAYSWGCFLALQWARRTQQPLKKLVLINPTLVPENPVSGLANTLTGLPVVGNVLLNKVAVAKVPEFLEKSFAPAKPSDEHHRKVMQALSDPSVWRKALLRKVMQQEHPIPEQPLNSQVEVVVVRGAQDQSVPWEPQHRVLKSLAGNRLVVHEIADAGHAAPWSHTAQVVALLGASGNDNLAIASNASAMDLNVRIGYQPGETVNNNITCYLERHLMRFPDRPALRWVDSKEVAAFDGNHAAPFKHHQVTYRQFAQGIRSVARGLMNLGIQKGDRVILFLPMSVGMYTAMCAIQRIGAIAVFLDSWARRTHLGASAECVDPKAMISHKAAFDLVAQVPEFNSMKLRIIAGPGNDGSYDAQLEELFKTPGDIEVAPVESEFTALITFTTGSSGKPKGANRTHRFLAAQHEALWDVIPYTPDDSDMPAFPIFSLNNLASGVTTVLPAIDLASPSEKDAAALVSQMNNEKISCTTLSPSMLNNVSAYCITNQVSLDSLRRVVTGGAPISKDNVRDFKSIAPNAEIWILYGSTEVEPMAHIEAQEMLSLPEDPDPEIIESGVNVGHVSEELRYKFIKPTHDNIDFSQTGWDALEVPKGHVGEFIVTGDHVCQDYYNNPEAFYKTKIRDAEGAVWHRTGDLARIDEQGYLWVVGRIHNMINRNEEYFFPVSAEIILKRFDFVRRCAFLGIPDAKLGERTAIVVELQDPGFDIRTGMQDILRVFKKNHILVDSFYVVDAIPMDPRHHSKVEYHILREQLLANPTTDLLA